jgi:predicted transcriptional regulator
MSNLTPCETITKGFLPAIKIAIARELSGKYDLTEVQIAKNLGLTQAAVSKYLTGNVSQKLKDVSETSVIRGMASQIAAKAAQDISKNKVSAEICNSCLNNSDMACGYHELNKSYRAMLDIIEQEIIAKR